MSQVETSIKKEIKSISVTCPCCKKLLCYIYSKDIVLQESIEVFKDPESFTIEIKCNRCKKIIKIPATAIYNLSA
jgi:phage FluMu protein Com